MILLDTHIWVWWVHGSGELGKDHAEYIEPHEGEGLGVSIISCWEIAKVVERDRLMLPIPVDTWLSQALAYPGVHLLPITPQIAVASTQLPGRFHRDPADQIIVATARVHASTLVTADQKIIGYPHVRKVP